MNKTYLDEVDYCLTLPPAKTKMLRHIGRDGNHERYEEWWLDADGYPTHPVDAEDDT